MRIAIIGSGISGLTSALCLGEKYDVTLIEKEHRLGGHTNTTNIDLKGRTVAVDTGFIVFNNKNYPMFSNFLKHLNVESEWSDMSFGFSVDEGKMEYACDNLDKIFAQRLNLINPKFINGFLDVLRFQRQSLKDLSEGNVGDSTLGEYLEEKKFGNWLKDNYLLPLGASIWSSSTSSILDFPARNFILFFKNHDLMTGLKPAQRWRTVSGGAKKYVDEIMSRFNGKVRTGAEAVSVSRHNKKIRLMFHDGSSDQFDHLVFSCDAPAAIKILGNQSEHHCNELENFQTSSNECIVHCDESLMPLHKKVWSSWNFLSQGANIDRLSPVCLTYWMNRLQNLDGRTQIFLSLNPQREIQADKIFSKVTYKHPVMNLESFTRQKNLKKMQGKGNIWFTGAWLGNGFHEDGIVSALEVCKCFGDLPQWVFDDTYVYGSSNLRAAE